MTPLWPVIASSASRRAPALLTVWAGEDDGGAAAERAVAAVGPAPAAQEVVVGEEPVAGPRARPRGRPARSCETSGSRGGVQAAHELLEERWGGRELKAHDPTAGRARHGRAAVQLPKTAVQGISPTADNRGCPHGGGQTLGSGGLPGVEAGGCGLGWGAAPPFPLRGRNLAQVGLAQAGRDPAVPAAAGRAPRLPARWCPRNRRW